MKIKATINYKMKPTHPDISYVIGGYTPGQVLTFTDVYTFDRDRYPDLTREDAQGYAKRDLLLIAGGGYNSDHIYDVSFCFS